MTERYRQIDHTADVGIQAFGRSLEELFANAAWGFLDTLTDATRVLEAESRKIEATGNDREELLAHFLIELLYRFATARELFTRFHFERLDEGKVVATVWGEPFDRARHPVRHDIKAVTYHGLKISSTDAGFTATVIFDI